MLKFKGVSNLITKSCLIMVVLISAVSFSFASNDVPSSEDVYSYLIKNSEVTFAVSSALDENEFINSTFSSEKKTIFLETEKEISFIQILNIDGELEYQLPISSRKLHIDMNDFTTGNYYLNLLLEGNDEYISTEIEKIF